MLNFPHGHLGYFADERAAGKACDDVTKKYLGEFGSVNFPESAKEGSDD